MTLYWTGNLALLFYIALSVVFAAASIKFYFFARENGKKWLIASLTFFILFLFSGFCSYETVAKDIKDLGYETSYEDISCQIKVDNIISEKGKETKYLISSPYGETVIPESIYNQYLGDDYNTLTLKKASLDIYVGHTFPFKDTSFLGQKNWLPFISKSKFSWPWEPAVAPYTNEEIKELANLFLTGEIKPNASTSRSVTNRIKAIPK